MLAFTDARGRVAVAFTDRSGGVSSPPYAELSLTVPARPVEGCDVAVLRAEVAENRVRVSRAATGEDRGDLLRTMSQVHGAGVAYVGGDAPGGADPEADALLTDKPGAVLAARAADCVPVLLGDGETGVVAAVHAGREGLLAGVVSRAVAALRGRGARRLTAWIGPHVCGRCYEVPASMRDEVAAAVPGTGSETSWGTPSLDLGSGVRRQLEQDAADMHVEVVAFEPCTVEDERFYSHRRQGAASGRHAGLVWLRR